MIREIVVKTNQEDACIGVYTVLGAQRGDCFPRVNRADSGDEAGNVSRGQPVRDILCHLMGLECTSKIIENL